MPKIIGGSLAEHREETRRRLFAALGDLLEQRGFDAITLADIAQVAGVGRTAVYNHVPDKESLLIAYITDETDRYLADLERALDGADDPVEELRTYVRHHLRVRRSFHVPPGLRTVVSPETQQRLREHAAPVEDLLRRIVEAGTAAGRFAPAPVETTVAMVNACLSSRGIPESGPAREAALAEVEAFVLRALGVTGG